MPFFSTTENSLGAAPLGFLAPVLYFYTVLSLVLRPRRIPAD